MRALALVAVMATFVVSGATSSEAQVYNLRAYSDCRGPGVAHSKLPMGSLIETVAPRRVAGRVMKVHRRPGHPRGRHKQVGYASVFNDGGRTATGRSGGIATRNTWALGGYWIVYAPNGKVAIVRQNDSGPYIYHRWIDITPSAVGHWGYSYGGFPTDAGLWTGYYLGSLPQGARVGRQRISALGICGQRGRISFRVKRRGPMPPKVRPRG